MWVESLILQTFDGLNSDEELGTQFLSGITCT